LLDFGPLPMVDATSDRTVAESRGARLIRFQRPVRPAPAAQSLEPSAADWYELGREREAAAIDGTPVDAAAGEAARARAIEAYLYALAMAPDYFEAHLDLGRCLHEQGDVEGARSHYNSAVELAPADATAWFNLGVALEDLGRGEEALAAYDRACALESRLADAHFNAARLLEERGERAEAVRRLKLYRQLVTER
jgi:tetratricopeptide (TPR) repeat protein